MLYSGVEGVPEFESVEFTPKHSDYCVLIPVLNEGERIIHELERAQKHRIAEKYDIIICDANSTDGCTAPERLKALGVNALLIKLGTGKQGAQLRMGFWWAIQQDYKGYVTIDGNNKDSIEDVPRLVEKLNENYDFVQGSRFVKGGRAVNTPLVRYLSVRFIHAPIISLTARHWFTDTTNAFRAYSKKYITHPDLQIFRDVFTTYELLAYLSVRATQLGMNACEVPVTRAYPKTGKIPTKIHPIRGNLLLIKILFRNLLGKYNP